MSGPLLFSDMLILPTGHILIIDGATRGCAGWHMATRPALNPYLYNPNKPIGRRFAVLQSTKIPKMHHSCVILLPDSRVLDIRENPNERCTFKNVAFLTELRLHVFELYYMDHFFHHTRPGKVSLSYANGGDGARYGEDIRAWFKILERVKERELKFSLYAPPFTTHWFLMNQRMLRLWCKRMER
ncbi:hypothetical protein NE237_025745 [Protea cynaroides]|uniref:Uncharacterized protein n=1 Tax=Protea cynaroides TaxID=273540 RepID=A0A9Q0H3Q1_9MAGN|nr:hypothetical protein NE237_025745 [Protea cynaroides]